MNELLTLTNIGLLCSSSEYMPAEKLPRSLFRLDFVEQCAESGICTDAVKGLIDAHDNQP